jgi:hypothetical protein
LNAGLLFSKGQKIRKGSVTDQKSHQKESERKEGKAQKRRFSAIATKAREAEAAAPVAQSRKGAAKAEAEAAEGAALI